MAEIETPDERKAREFFQHFGYNVDRLEPVGSRKCADYRVLNHNERHIIEVKKRIPDAEFARQIEQFLWAESEEPIARTNVISRQIGDAADQLNATDPEDASAFRLITFVVAEDDPDIHVEQFQRTLFGTVELLTESSGGVVAVPCFYFTFNDFFRFRCIDASIILSPWGARLCVNAFGSRREQLRGTLLYRILATAGAVTDPDILEGANEAFVADTDMDRRDEAAVLAYVRTKYDRPELLTFNPKRIRVATKSLRKPAAGSESQ